MWAPFARLVTERELIAFDPPGAGLSQRPRGPCGCASWPRVVRELLDALGLERVDVLGYSFGGGLAQELARRAPDRVRRLVLCATGAGPGRRPAEAAGRARCWRRPRGTTTRGCSRSASRTSRAGGPRATRRVLAAHAGERLRRPPDVLGYAYQLYAAAGWSSLPWLHRVKQPTLVVAGDDDPSVPVLQRPAARRAAARTPACT